MKVLIISYNPLTLSNNGGKYFVSLFSDFTRDEIAQLYVHNTLPDERRCHSYYRITDKDILYKIFGRNEQHEITDNEILQQDLKQKHERFTINADKNRHFKLILRDFMWKIISWETDDLYRWIENERPECIFADTGDSCFLYNISMKIAQKYKLPLVCSFGDDYYSIPYSLKNPIKSIQLWLLRKKISQFVMKCNKVITLNDKFTAYYKNCFNVKNSDKMESVYMGESLSIDSFEYLKHEFKCKSLILSYIGNLCLGRLENLMDIGKAIQTYNQMNHTQHVLRIYANINSAIIEQCSNIPAIDLQGLIPGNEVAKAIEKSDILIHTESFLQENISQTRYSISTKIADSLRSKRCIVAYGPECIASMEHLINNDAAFCITSKDTLNSALGTILGDGQLIDTYANKAILCAEKFHKSSVNSKQLRNILARCMDA